MRLERDRLGITVSVTHDLRRILERRLKVFVCFARGFYRWISECDTRAAVLICKGKASAA